MFTIIGAALALLLASSPARAGLTDANEAGISIYGNLDLDLDGNDLYSAGVLVSTAWVLARGECMNLGLRLDLRLEASLGNFRDHANGAEAALVPGLRLYLGSAMFQPYLEAGVGPSINSLDIEELGTRFNFLSYGGLGLRFSAGPSSWWEVGGRVRHISNAGLDERNQGVTAGQVQVGYVWEF